MLCIRRLAGPSARRLTEESFVLIELDSRDWTLRIVVGRMRSTKPSKLA